MRWSFWFLLVALLTVIFLSGCAERNVTPIGMAVEFNSHAGAAYVTQDKGWYQEEGIELNSYESYVTGVALASALARGDIEVAYICLVPAINVYANGGVPIKIVAGTHKYGYGLVVNPEKVKAVNDLGKPGIRIGCVREGGATELCLYLTIDKFDLDQDKVLGNVQRMNPPNQLLAIRHGKLDAAFLPEHWTSLAERFGFKMMLTAEDIWPEMQGSVLVVKEDLIRYHPDAVVKLVATCRRATSWINQHPGEAAEIIARRLGAIGNDILPTEVTSVAKELEIKAGDMERSMGNIEYSVAIDPEVVQQTIDYLAELGHIKSSFDARDILDLRFIDDDLA